MGYSPEGLKGAGTNPRRPAPGAKFGLRGWLRWMWRQLTSMRVALMLLLLLAVAALPGSFFPQRPADPAAVATYYSDHPELAPWLERLGLFNVYGSPWFSAVYILLFVSLIGCILPRVLVHLHAMRSGPARLPRNFKRFPIQAEFLTPLSPEEALGKLRIGRLHKVERHADENGAHLSSETGYGRETGNIVFHLALVGLLIAMAWGHMIHYRGQALVVEGNSFVNAPLDYDSFDAGPLSDEESMQPFRFTLEEFFSEFTVGARALDFRADVTVHYPSGEARPETIRVNDPLDIDGARVYLQGNGFAPSITVRDTGGEVAFSGPVPFLPQDEVYASTGVVTVPDANMGENQLGFQGTFLPSAIPSDDGAFVGSAHPAPIDPVLILQLWEGDLGLDEGIPKSLLVLDTENMTQVMIPGDDGEGGDEVPYRAVLRPGEEVELPDGRGTVSFDSLPRFVALDLRYDPSIMWMGGFAVLAMLGLSGSLFLRRRRIWVKLEPRGEETLVTAAALARGDDPGLERALERVLAELPDVEEQQPDDSDDTEGK